MSPISVPRYRLQAGKGTGHQYGRGSGIRSSGYNVRISAVMTSLVGCSCPSTLSNETSSTYRPKWPHLRYQERAAFFENPAGSYRSGCHPSSYITGREEGRLATERGHMGNGQTSLVEVIGEGLTYEQQPLGRPSAWFVLPSGTCVKSPPGNSDGHQQGARKAQYG